MSEHKGVDVLGVSRKLCPDYFQRTVLQENFTKLNIKRCSRCYYSIEKASGCDDMR